MAGKVLSYRVTWPLLLSSWFTMILLAHSMYDTGVESEPMEQTELTYQPLELQDHPVSAA